MDFLKKIFGGSDKKDESQGSQNRTQGGAETMGDLRQSATKSDHDGGHPTGKGGKNVCEFC